MRARGGRTPSAVDNPGIGRCATSNMPVARLLSGELSAPVVYRRLPALSSHPPPAFPQMPPRCGEQVRPETAYAVFNALPRLPVLFQVVFPVSTPYHRFKHSLHSHPHGDAFKCSIILKSLSGSVSRRGRFGFFLWEPDTSFIGKGVILIPNPNPPLADGKKSLIEKLLPNPLGVSLICTGALRW